ncbi:hypothetical protein FRC04_001432 [Tulasnella sp. 424]|nr:hypothetical protein FRC04_001432 [Tulasnella sp. 424]
MTTEGNDPSAEAEGFIAAIKKLAFKERKQRDNDWLCDYTATCLRGEALRWFAKLEMEQPEVVENWKLMQNAILTHYPRPTEETGENRDNSNRVPLVPTPAAARSSSSSTRAPSVDSEAQQEQRIRVLNEDGELLGYLGRAGHLLPDYWQGCLDAACDEEDAFRVIVKPCTDGTKLSRIFVSGPDKWLGIQWQESFRSRAAVTLFEEDKDGSLTSRLQPHRWEGEARDGGSYDTYGFIAYEPGNGAGGTTILHVKSKAWTYALRNIKWDLAVRNSQFDDRVMQEVDSLSVQTLELEDC